MLPRYDYHTGNTYELCSNNLLRTLDKGSDASQSAIALIIRTSDICCNQMVCKRLAGSQRILLEINGLLIIIVRLFYILLIYHQIPLNIIKNIEICEQIFYNKLKNY